MTAALQRLLTFMSPAFPVGGFAWSQGLETAIADRRIVDAATLKDWIGGLLLHGGMRTDAILLSHAHRHAHDPAALREAADLCLALTVSSERRAEAVLTGEAFMLAARAWPSDVFARLPDPCPYPVAVGAIAAAHGIAAIDALAGYLTAAVHAQISVAVRLVPLGQTAGLQAMAVLESVVTSVAAEAAIATLDDIGGIAYAADIAQMRHEVLEPRVFRS